MVRLKFLNIFYVLVVLGSSIDVCLLSIQKPFLKYNLLRLPLINPAQLNDHPQAIKASLYLPLKIFEQNYILSLYRGKSVFTPDATIVIHKEDNCKSDSVYNAMDIKTEIVEGWVVGHPRSKVHGYLDEGVFNGVINIDGKRYFMESASKFLNGTDVGDVVVYRSSDVILPSQLHGSFDQDMKENESRAYCKSDGQDIVNGFSEQRYDFVRPPRDRTGKVCKLKVVSDHWFMHDLHSNNMRRAIKSMEFHIKEADSMFRGTDFDNNGRADNVRIKVVRADVYHNPNDRNYYLSDPSMDAKAYLEKFSYYNHDGFCGAMAFSHRRFPDDVLGYAYRGGPNKIGGICYRRRTVQGRERSMNVGMVSFNAPWGNLALAQSAIVVTHELGHMFGSPHDEDIEGGACFKPEKEDHFIMSAMANPGTSSTNRKFSSCSMRQILTNLKIHGNCLDCRGRECGAVTFTHPKKLLFILFIFTLCVFYY